jgi:type IV secretory pathway VirB4 component
VAWLSEALRRIGLDPTRLGVDEVTGLLYRLMGDRATALQPLDGGASRRWADAVAPAAFREDPAEVRLGMRLARTLAVTAYPQLIRPSWLDVLLGYDGDLDLSLHIAPASTRAMVASLDRRIAQLGSTIRIAQEDGGSGDAYRRAALTDARDLQDRVARGEERLFEAALYLTVWADTREELEVATRRVEALLGSVMVNSRWLLFRMEPGFVAGLPLGIDRVGLRRTLPTSVLAATFPFSGNDLSASSGLLYGINPDARSAVVVDRFALPNHNAVVFGCSGAGKSYTVKLELLRGILAGLRVVVVDPESEYGGVVDAVGGVTIPLRPGAACGLDPFAVAPGEQGALTDRIASLLTLVELLAGGLSPNQRAAAEEALSFAYASRGYTDAGSVGEAPPTLADVHEALMRRAERWTPQVRGEVAELASRLDRYVSGSGAWLLDHAASPAGAESGSVVYDIKGLPEEDRAPAMFLILQRIWAQLDRASAKTLVVIDEGWRLMQHPDSAQYVLRLAKTARKRLAGLTLISQDVSDVLGSPVGSAVVNTSAVQILMRHEPQAMPVLASTFDLTEAEQTWLINARPGEGLILAMGRRLPFASVASDEEARVIREAVA